MSISKRTIVPLAAVALFAAVWAGFAPSIARWLVTEKPIEKPDAIIVLSGGATVVERNLYAADLFRQGIAPRIVLTNDGERGGWDQNVQRNPSYYELARRELVTAGVPEAAITVLPEVVSGTREEAALIASRSNALGLSGVLLVTSPHHTRRALLTFEHAFGASVAVGIASPPAVDDRFWYLAARGWRDVAGEYVKLAVYWASF